MNEETLINYDFSRWEEPDPDLGPRELLVSWLGYQRHEFLRKLRDLTPEALCRWSIPPLELSVLGLVRHMTQMEHTYLAWGLGGGVQAFVYGDDDYAGGSVQTVSDDFDLYRLEVAKADVAIAGMASLDTRGLGHGRTLRATLIKMVDEYAIHAGQAHMLRFAALGEILR